ncbi:Uncharacterised protein [Streptococcus pneumoniae]|uniref:hypothetical protein n=1 Tax=Bacillus cereus group TaxID=86661 RepID=UPI0005DE798B|nr:MULTISPECIES: hypothetical protein [Bacillus cereus group]CEY39152.1 Uncharacterised protein [Streptococcus pneumoniae]HDR7530537.1 hypothetical protein [Bacillus anthracis]PFY39577.1 hypothetical protein COL50_23785 [Bacillus toyonensis]CGF83706.1 Uncharacterised protein [Streptococcus pneumoniae]CIZ50008.1 Uncharacterised protein [Streptococcus pneumoniae]
MARKTKQMLEQEVALLKLELTDKEFELEYLKEKLNEVELEKEYWFIESEIFSFHLTKEKLKQKGCYEHYKEECDKDIKKLENVKKYKMLEIKARQKSKLKEYIMGEYYNATCGGF